MDDIDKIIERVDQATPSPNDRAIHVWNLLRAEHPELTNWDLVCFAANLLGYISPAFPWLHDDAKAICNLIYKAHYLNGDKLDVSSSISRGDAQPVPDGRDGQRKSLSDIARFTLEGDASE